MNFVLQSSYLLGLVALLLVAAVLVARQVWRTRGVETRLSQLQKRVNDGQATGLDYYELGSIFLRKKLYVQCVNQLQKAIKNWDESDTDGLAKVHNALGYAYFSQEQYDLAIRQYREALKRQPQYVTGMNNLGHAYEKKKLTAQALEMYEQALQIAPDDPTAKQRANSLRKRLAPTG
ncbi:Tetratricopeptide repeat-containing protein [Gloeomargarita lithophora Alchichica-D10]|uniref:Tetratricopeptide repeat-containing protein n=1 Tax=Gloeomargarita lithophora Alchichica-D10 TaxID=1188229 RepID=A0A1J0ACQ5_9CYAN|nr:tetratricopeptide repeat protein [Gloeomargarita lithophora]APB33699.1 Tetratricopeptide repeat-containing protein [Gloeomargarita lithophora Alchichica-D10]